MDSIPEITQRVRLLRMKVKGTDDRYKRKAYNAEIIQLEAKLARLKEPEISMVRATEEDFERAKDFEGLDVPLNPKAQP